MENPIKAEIEEAKNEIRETKAGLREARNDIVSQVKDGPVENIEQIRKNLKCNIENGINFEKYATEYKPQSGMTRLKRVAIALRWTCCVLKWGSAAAVLINLAISVVMIFSPEVGEWMLDKYILNKFIDTFNYIPGVSKLSDNMMVSIQAFIGALIMAAAYFMLGLVDNVMDDMIRSEQPFNRQAGLKLRHIPVFTLLLMFWNPWMGIFVFLVSVVISAVFDYGIYLAEQNEKTSEIQENVILSLAEITEARSGQTGQHVKRVAEYSYLISLEMGYSKTAAENIKYASMMHDVGKISVPLEILEKPGKLTDEEFAIIKTHTTEGERLLHNANGEIMRLSKAIALEHHERWDGRGYPDGKKGKEIVDVARIVSVADVYDALTSARSYKDAWTPGDAYEEIVKCSGTQFDPEVVEAFKRCYTDMMVVRENFADGPVRQLDEE